MLSNAGLNTALAVGLMLMAIIYAGGHISGGHYNPIVTIAVWLRGKCSVADVPVYIFAQLIGGALAALAVDSILLHKLGNATLPNGNAMQLLIAELLGSFILVYTILHVATTKDTAGNSFYGLAAGACLAACVSSLGVVSGGAFNPIVSLGMSISKVSSFSSIWLYWIGELLGGIGATYAFLFINGKE